MTQRTEAVEIKLKRAPDGEVLFERDSYELHAVEELRLSTASSCCIWISPNLSAENAGSELLAESSPDRWDAQFQSWHRFDLEPGRVKRLRVNGGKFKLLPGDLGEGRPTGNGGGEGSSGGLSVKTG